MIWRDDSFLALYNRQSTGIIITELPPLRYLTAFGQWKGDREALGDSTSHSRPISRAVSDIEAELGLKLFSRVKRVAQLTPEGKVFYA
jgi:hypothetical protein